MPERREIILPIHCSTVKMLRKHIVTAALAVWGISAGIVWVLILANHIDVHQILQSSDLIFWVGVYLILGLMIDMLAIIVAVVFVVVGGILRAIDWIAGRIPRFKCIVDEPTVEDE